MTENSNVLLAGPWASLQEVREYLGLATDSEVERMVDQRELLGCRFRDRKMYLPIRQFANHTVVAGLNDVLNILASGIASPQVWATWMAAAPDGITAWEQLRIGNVDTVILDARRDASR
jgi:hypothetical protein